MKNNGKKNVLVLGANGMVGETIFTYLETLKDITVYGTTRKRSKNKSNQFFFEAEDNKNKLIKIIKGKKIDILINCIGVIKNSESIEKLITVNALFPHTLEKLAEKYNIQLIHISTDGVFADLSETVTESSLPSPENKYGASKLLGETTSNNAITFRTSFIGLDSKTHQGILENALQNKDTFIGYKNHIWTGCTTLQFSELCVYVMKKNNFLKLRKVSPIFHFAPIGPVSKYELVNIFMLLVYPEVSIKKSTKEKRVRILKTNYADVIKLEKYTMELKEVMKKLIKFSRNSEYFQ